MEKIVTLLWKHKTLSKQEFCEKLLQEISLELIELGARQLKIAVNDGRVVAGANLAMTPTDQAKSAMVSYWLDMAENRTDIENRLNSCCQQLASYLVVESVPIVFDNPKAEGTMALTPGFSQVSCIKARDDISYDAFIKIWHSSHMQCAIETQSSFQYIRNEIVRPLTAPEKDEIPNWTAIVEESFPIEALDDPYVFFDAVGDQKKLEGNINRMVESCQRFLELETTDVTATSEYLFSESENASA